MRRKSRNLLPGENADPLPKSDDCLELCSDWISAKGGAIGLLKKVWGKIDHFRQFAVPMANQLFLSAFVWIAVNGRWLDKVLSQRNVSFEFSPQKRRWARDEDLQDGVQKLAETDQARGNNQSSSPGVTQCVAASTKTSTLSPDPTPDDLRCFHSFFPSPTPPQFSCIRQNGSVLGSAIQ